MATGGNALGDYLRARRQRVRPEDVGLVPGARRRVAGLRREELATLAGISGRVLPVKTPVLLTAAEAAGELRRLTARLAA